MHSNHDRGHTCVRIKLNYNVQQVRYYTYQLDEWHFAKTYQKMIPRALGVAECAVRATLTSNCVGAWAWTLAKARLTRPPDRPRAPGGGHVTIRRPSHAEVRPASARGAHKPGEPEQTQPQAMSVQRDAN